MDDFKPNILIAEDEPEFAEQLIGALEDESYNTMWAHDGQEALKLLSENKIDLGFIDVIMPGVDGMRVIEEATKAYPEIPMIVMTGFPSIEKAIKATRLGAYDYIEKPADLNRLLLAAQKALEKRKLALKNKWITEDILERYKMIGSGPGMQNIYATIDKVAPTDGSVLITGEHGTGKELAARAIHMQSNRATGPFIKVNCAAIPENLIESELFGFEKHSFTDARSDKPGKFLLADNGTIFLDEIGDMSLSAQAKILRVLQEQTLTPIGSTKEIPINVRVLAATNKNIQEMISRSIFREDLYYRLNTIEIQMPTLNERKEDLPELINHFLRSSCENNSRYVKGFSPQAMQIMMNYSWPGNVRELGNMINRLVILSDQETISVNDVDKCLNDADDEKVEQTDYRSAMLKCERKIISQALIAQNWNIGKTAQVLQIDRTNLFKKMQKLGIKNEKREG